LNYREKFEVLFYQIFIMICLIKLSKKKLINYCKGYNESSSFSKKNVL
jgi:hypothetical protein